jgi:multiple antibiotic resistance protein
VLIALFVIVNPIGAAPVFLTMTSNWPAAQRKRTALSAGLTVACVLVGSVLAGEWVLRLFGIDVPCFQVGGGILVLLIAVSMLHARPSRAKQTPEEARQAEEQETAGVVPLGTPLLAGPGTISTAIIYAQAAKTMWETAMLIAASLIVALCAWTALRLADPIGALLGRTGINIVTRLMGLILAAVAVKFIADGVSHLLPGLAATGG